MTAFETFPDAEKVFEAWLRATFPLELGLTDDDPTKWHTATSFPPDLAARLPLLVVGRLGGVTGRLEDFPILDVDTFHSTRAAAISLDARISAAFLGYPHVVGLDTRTVVLDQVTQSRGQVPVPWEDSNVRRIASTYQFSVRR